MTLRVLVVDDIAASRDALVALVRELGHEAWEAASGAAALALFERQRPDLVLLDLLMPDLDGFAVTRALRERSAQCWVPVIVTSALDGEDHFIHALQEGADDYLQRPISPDLLRAKLRHYADVLELQARVSAAAQRHRDILDNVLDAVITVAADDRIEDLNVAARALTTAAGRPLQPGMACADAIGQPLAALQHGQRLEAYRHASQPFPAEVALSQWHDAGRVFTTLVLRDLTEQQQVQRMKDEFLATVSHELRTPLTSVLGALALLAGGAAGELPAPARTLAEVARRNGDRLSRLVDDVLDLTKMEGDRLVLRPRFQPVVPLLRESLAANQGYADRAGVQLVAEGLEQWPSLQLRLDADRFLQVLANLLSNAIKHSPAGERVVLSLAVLPSGVELAVRDRGPGIPAQFRARLFEKFAQADGGDRRVQGGTGLGLYITRLLVERMDGRIEADSVAGEGAVFRLTFPLAATAALPDAGVHAGLVLHVDADFEARDRVTRWLVPTFRVEGAVSLEQARALAAGEPPLLWLANPQAQGSADDFCAELRQLAAGRTVLLYGDSVDAAYSARVGLPWVSAARTSADDLRALIDRLVTAPRSNGGRS